MNEHIVKNMTAAILAPVLLVVLSAPAAWAEESSILAGDEEIEDWVREMQAEILFFTASDRADEIGGKAVDKANEKWGDDNQWALRYVLLHSVLAQTNSALVKLVDVNSQPDDFPDKRKFFDTFFGFTMEGMNQITPMSASIDDSKDLSADEKDMAEMLGAATQGRVLCSISRIASNAPAGLNDKGDKHFKTAIKTLKKASAENIADIARGIELAEIATGEIDPSNRKDLVKTLEEQRDLVCGR